MKRTFECGREKGVQSLHICGFGQIFSFRCQRQVSFKEECRKKVWRQIPKGIEKKLRDGVFEIFEKHGVERRCGNVHDGR